MKKEQCQINSNKHIKNLVRGMSISLVGTGCLGILNYFVRREMALSLTVVDFGFIYSSLALCSIFLAYLDVGLGQSATILMSKSVASDNKEDTNKYYFQIFIIKFVLSIIIVLLLMATSYYWLNDFFKYNKASIFFIIIILIIIQSVISAPGSILMATKQFLQFSIAQILTPIFILAFLFLSPLWLKNYPMSCAIAFPFGSLISVLFLLVVATKSGFFPRIRSFSEIFNLGPLFHLSKWIAISSLALTTMYYMDSIMLTWLDGLQAVGLYNIALPIMQIVQSMMILPIIFLPIVSEMWHQKEEREIGAISSMVTEITLYITWPIVFTIILIAKYLIVFLFSEKFTAATPALIILFIGNIFYSLGYFYMGILNSGSYAKVVAITVLISAILNIFLNYFLIPYFSLVGAALSTAISYGAIAVFLYFLSKKYVPNMSLNSKRITSITIPGIIFSIVSLYFYTKATLSVTDTILIIIVLNALYVIFSFKIIRSYIRTTFSFLKAKHD